MNAGCWSRRAFLGGAVLGPVLLSGCGGQRTDLSAPPRLTLGRDTCDSCGMIISDERYAAALVDPEGTVRLFDDIGEMLQALGAAGRGEQRAWVHDWTSRAWTDAAASSYVRGDPAVTPMGFGIVAFSDREEAAAFAAERNVPVMTWEEALALDL